MAADRPALENAFVDDEVVEVARGSGDCSAGGRVGAAGTIAAIGGSVEKEGCIAPVLQLLSCCFDCAPAPR